MDNDKDASHAEGVVHGHIHNFNNLTYIHGHVHRRASFIEGELQPSTPFVPEIQETSEAAMTPDASEVAVDIEEPDICSQFRDCQHFEFINYHNLNVFSENVQAAPLSDELLVVPEKRRKLADCSCQPRVVKICCDADHDNGSEDQKLPVNDDIVLFTNDQKPTSLPNNSTLPEFIDCDLTCAPAGINDDQMFEELCEQCMNLNDQEDGSVHSHLHTRAHSHPHDILPPNELRCHDHIINTSTDLKILEDLTSISSMYDFPFGKHVHSNTTAKPHELNLLQTSIAAVKTEEDDNEQNKTHHHHRIELHPHPTLTANAPQGYSNERDTQSSDVFSAEYSKLHHYAPQPSQAAKMTRTNTINFNWCFKDELSKTDCHWGHCYQTCDNLIDLQKHILKDHILDSPLPTVLPTPRSQFDCNWGECDYSGDDVCSLVNHINGQHGIAFDMKFVDQHELEEQSERHHLLHRPEFSPQQPLKCYHTCKWNYCDQEFTNEEELNNHIEMCHISRGKSSYQCNWDSCGKVFSQRQKVLRHLKVHTRYKPFECPHCTKSFSTEDILQQHIRTHSGEKPFKCTYCAKSFATSSSLRIHIRTHTGEKPLECKICQKRFNESSNLSKHMKTHERQFKCGVCKRSFHKFDQLKIHQSRCSCCRSAVSSRLQEGQ